MLIGVFFRSSVTAVILIPCRSISFLRTGNCISTVPGKVTNWTPSGIVADERERMDRLRSLAGKYFPAGYDTETDILRNGPRAAVLAFTIEHISGKAVREK